MDEKGVDEVQGGRGMQGVLALFHLPNYEVLQLLQLLIGPGLVLGSWQVLIPE